MGKDGDGQQGGIRSLDNINHGVAVDVDLLSRPQKGGIGRFEIILIFKKYAPVFVVVFERYGRDSDGALQFGNEFVAIDRRSLISRNLCGTGARNKGAHDHKQNQRAEQS